MYRTKTLVLQKVRQNDKIWVEPENDKDLAIFKHCTGEYAVLNYKFNGFYKPIFDFHNCIVRIIDRTKNSKYSQIKS